MPWTRHQFRLQADRWGAFANLGDQGSYSFPSQLVQLDAVELAHAAACDAGAPAGRFKVLPLAAHEYTHWLDHVSTLWGRRSLIKYYSALAARAENNEHVFGPAVVDAWEAIRRIRSDSYFLAKGPRNIGAPWFSTTSCGVRFDAFGRPDESDPVPFIRFADPELIRLPGDASLIVRTPLSVVALTECTAQAAEYAWTIAEAGARGKDTPARPAAWLQRMSSSLFERDNAMYTAAFHCVANHASISAAVDVIRYAPALSSLVLNLPADCFASLRSAPDMHPSWYRRADAASDRLDPGMAFLALLSHRVPTKQRPVEDWIADVLQAAGLPALSDLEQARMEEFAQHEEDAPDSPRLLASLRSGTVWATTRGILGSPDALVDALNGRSDLSLPEAILGDGNTWCPDRALEHGDGRNAVDWFDHHYDLEKQMHELLVACRRA